LSYKYILNPKYHTFKEHLLHIQTLFQSTGETIHKARNELKTLDIEGNEYIVKSFKVPHLLNRFIYTFFRDSKAKKSYDNAIKIGDFAPTPVAFIEYYKSSLLEKSYFIAEKFNYDFTIREPLLDKSFPDRDKIFKAFSRFTLDLHNNNIFHKDYSPGNILIKVLKNGEYLFKIVDINRMSFFNLNQKERAKNFSKLWADEETLITIATEYSKHYKASPSFIANVIYFSQKNKKIKNFKKRIKGKSISD